MIQYRSIREAEVQNRLTAEALRASHRLNVLAAIFLPLTAITGVFGMNLPTGLQQNALLFWAIAIASMLLGFILKTWVTASTSEKPKPK
jgi:Mg2+ and Co2+ transporter CorA